MNEAQKKLVKKYKQMGGLVASMDMDKVAEALDCVEATGSDSK